MPGFGPASAPVAICGVLGFLEAPSSYKFDYIRLAFQSNLPSLTTNELQQIVSADAAGQENTLGAHSQFAVTNV